MLLAQAAIAGVVAFALVWACYRFSVGRLDDLPPMDYIGTPVLPPVGQRSALLAWFCRLRLPAPEFWDGFLFLKAHDKHGHSAYLFGQIRDRGGFWDFYLVGLLLKSPLPFLLLLVACVPALLRRGAAASRRPGARRRVRDAGGAGALDAADGEHRAAPPADRRAPAGDLHRRRASRPGSRTRVQRGGRDRLVAMLAFGVVLVASVATVERARPQLMAYFNPLAGREPGHALIDSDLDWGQDFFLLKRELRARQISTAHYGFFGTMNPCGPDMPELLPLVPKVPVTGWIVLSEQFYRSDFFVSIRREYCASPHIEFKLEPGDSVRLAQELRARRANWRHAPAVPRSRTLSARAPIRGGVARAVRVLEHEADAADSSFTTAWAERTPGRRCRRTARTGTNGSR